MPKGFDRVPHNPLLYRLVGPVLDLLRSFLTGCIFVVKVSNTISDPSDYRGFPQDISWAPTTPSLYQQSLVPPEQQCDVRR